MDSDKVNQALRNQLLVITVVILIIAGRQPVVGSQIKSFVLDEANYSEHLEEPAEALELDISELAELDESEDIDSQQQQQEQDEQASQQESNNDYDDEVSPGGRFRRDSLADAFSCPVQTINNCTGHFCSFRMLFYSPIERRDIKLSFGGSSDNDVLSWLDSVRLDSVDWTALGSRVSDWVKKMANAGRGEQSDVELIDGGVERRTSRRPSLLERFGRSAELGPTTGRRQSSAGRSAQQWREESGWRPRDFEAMFKAGFDLNKPTLVYSHGYLETSNSEWMLILRERYNEMLEAKATNASNSVNTPSSVPFNLLIFDWSGLSVNIYSSAVARVPYIGQRVLGSFLKDLALDYNYNMDQMHLIGYSLSAQIFGMAGKAMVELGKPLGQITGLDPTGVCFTPNSVFGKKYSLNPSQAQLVVARHYDIGMMGSRGPVGGLDIYVDGGRNTLFNGRPASAVFAGSSSERYDSIEQMLIKFRNRVSKHVLASHHEYEPFDENCHDVAYACRSHSAFLDGECADCGKNNEKCYLVSNFGYYFLQSERGLRPNQLRPPPPTRPGERGSESSTDSPAETNPPQSRGRVRGEFYLDTNQQNPFCLHHYQLVWKTKPAASQQARTLLKSGSVSIELDSQTITRPMHQSQLDANRFTVLLKQPQRFKQWNDVTVGLGGEQDAESLKELFNSLDHIELNYMSHVLSEERQSASVRFCPETNSVGDNILVKCSID